MIGQHRLDSRRNMALANRLVLGWLTGDQDVPNLLGDEIHDCPKCWRTIALSLAALTGGEIEGRSGTDKALAEVEGVIAVHLDKLH